MVTRQIVAVAVASVLLAGAPVAQATTPGHNGRIVFSVETDNGIQLFTIRPNGSHLRQVTSVDGDAINADWSPDGHTIVFELDDADHAGIATIRPNGHGLHDLTPTGLQGQPAFTADGRHIVFDKLVNGVDDSLWIMRSDGTGLHRLTHNPFPEQGSDTDANVSPNGKVITFVRIKEPEVLQALFSVRIDGTHLHQLTSYRLEVGIKHDWAPDGSRIAIITHADPQPGQSANVATIRPDGTSLRRLTHYRGGETNAVTGSYSPNGRWIAYRLATPDSVALWKIRPNGSSKQRIRAFEEAPRYIDWGPTQ
jgi:Tol biopolymer transport system component